MNINLVLLSLLIISGAVLTALWLKVLRPVHKHGFIVCSWLVFSCSFVLLIARLSEPAESSVPESTAAETAAEEIIIEIINETEETTAETERAAEEETEEETEESTEAEVSPLHNLKGYYETRNEMGIYSFVQCPFDFYPDPRCTGDWVNITAGGQEFMYFGCGTCCLSNIWSTLTGEVITPDVMFERAKEKTDYNPDSGIGAISWRQLKQVLSESGLNVETKRKPSDYELFKKDAAEASTLLVLVCKDNDDKLWFYTNGHYVTIWEYDPETETVFVADPSGMFNRMRVDLIDIYNALKTSSDAQYMMIRSKGTEQTRELAHGSVQVPD